MSNVWSTSYNIWQSKWDVSDKRRWTHRLIRNVEQWMTRKFWECQFPPSSLPDTEASANIYTGSKTWWSKMRRLRSKCGWRWARLLLVQQVVETEEGTWGLHRRHHGARDDRSTYAPVKREVGNSSEVRGCRIVKKRGRGES